MAKVAQPVLLLVEDNSSDARATMRAIARVRPELSVKWVRQVAEAREYLGEVASKDGQVPGCMVLDLNLPGTSGVEFLRELREHEETCDLPVLVLTTSKHRQDREAAAMFGANGYATKVPGVDGLSETGAIIARFWDRHVKRERVPAAAPEDGAHQANAGRAVLLVEDDDGFARALERLLKRVLPDYELLRARHVGDALNILDSIEPAVILTDLGLPDSNAADTVARLVEKAPTAPVVVLTGRSFDELGPAAVDAGAQDFLTKSSIDAAELARVLRVAMRRNAVHYREVHAAHHDSLTGLANRSHFESSLATRCARAKRGDQCGLIFLDVDDFKRVNDKFGHRVGDAVLVAVANRIKQVVRCDDVAARWGGDEFAVLLGVVSTEFDAHSAATRIAESINAPLELTLQPTGETIVYDLSASMGVAMSGVGETALDEQAILVAADSAMYNSKVSKVPVVFW